MYCSRCGSKLKEGARYCIYCGQKIEDENETGFESYDKKNCKFLREVRKTIAEMNDIYTIDFSECSHKGPCIGICIKCDKEMEELEAAFSVKRMKGDKLFLPNVTVDGQKIIPSVHKWYELRDYEAKTELLCPPEKLETEKTLTETTELGGESGESGQGLGNHKIGVVPIIDPWIDMGLPSSFELDGESNGEKKKKFPWSK